MTITNIRNLDREHTGFRGAYWKGKEIPKHTGGMSYAMQRNFFFWEQNVIVWEPESVFIKIVSMSKYEYVLELPLLLSQSPLFATATGEENQYVYVYIYIHICI